MFLKRFWLLLSAIVILFPSWGSAQESTLDVAKRRGWVVAGVKNDFPPLGYLDQSGKWVGLDRLPAGYKKSGGVPGRTFCGRGGLGRQSDPQAGRK